MKRDQLIALKEESETMTRDEEKYVSTMNSSIKKENMDVETKIAEKEKLERLVSELKHGSLLLTQTAEILKNRQSTIELKMTTEEQNSNVKGFHSAQKALKDTVENVNKIDEIKGKTLEEISGMVTKITEKLKVERERLQPMVSVKTIRYTITSIFSKH